MTLFLMALPLILAAPPAAAQKIGERTGAPEQLFSGIGEGTDDAELERAVAAAAAHPLGTLANPVRVGGPEGARAYLGRLRCADGSAPQVSQPSDGGTGAYGTVTQLYRVDCGRAAPARTEIVMDLYHQEHRETRAPAGLSLLAR
ncbi:MAG TPA: hypothetical protein VGB70_01215 [Allosphingosinicella sp.]